MSIEETLCCSGHVWSTLRDREAVEESRKVSVEKTSFLCTPLNSDLRRLLAELELIWKSIILERECFFG